ncbi:single-stranded DNA-binding protein [Actinobaculum sp. 352]|uniref:single-stranded DNA-binding protein n=1 Tax=Actinobaculum sp. 352 TaxID=2490946 RepID=UPI000F7E0239|nr:single-stranded DNA-binding protein [Actinobaculum sp. 352]RTE49355.1 single-stranded DNA-binding protein [Actinobaculum sp. 352]
MANEPIVTITGNLTADPELRFTQAGIPVANLTVASTPRTLNRQTNQWEDGEPMFVRCSIWREYAENVAESLTKGMRVIVTGKLTVRSYEHNGQQRTSLELAVDEIGPALRYARAQVTRTTQGGQQAGHAPQSHETPAYGPNSGGGYPSTSPTENGPQSGDYAMPPF